MTNILENPHIGMIFLVPARGHARQRRASIIRDQEILARLSVRGRSPKVALGVEVEEAYLHCPRRSFARAL
jgi:predicted pyridoxine 5'-phosphate oxidase superfamily flavin-nucleotide-binding protein